MDRIARLITSSSDLRRRIWASIPFSLRVADFFSRLAVDTTDAFGAAVYGEFAKRGIDVPGLAPGFDPQRHRPPTGLGRQFGKKVFSTLMRKFHNAHFVEETMMDFMVKFLSGGSHGSANIDPSMTVSQAEGYVLKSVMWEALNSLRKRKREMNREISDVYFNDEGEQTHRELPVFDEDSVERQFKRQLPKMKSKLDRIHPDAALYVKLSVVDGHTDREIIGDVGNGVPSMLPHPYSSQGKPLTEKSWQNNYKQKIFDVLRSNFDYLQSVV